MTEWLAAKVIAFLVLF